MDTETVKWISGFILANALAWSALLGMIRVLMNRAKHTEAKMNTSLDKHDELIQLHESANKGLEESRDQQNRTNRELVFYLQWFVEKMSGEKPPPFIDGGKN